MTGPIDEPGAAEPTDPTSARPGDAERGGELDAQPSIEGEPPSVAWVAPESAPPPARSTGWIAPETPAGPTGWIAPETPPGPTGANSWVTPESPPGRSRLRGCLIGCALGLAVLVLLGIVFIIFVGGQVRSALGGTVQFGTGGEGCAVEARAESFAAGTDLHFVAWLKRDVAAGETITLVQTYPDGTTDPSSQAVESAASCMFGDAVSGPATGHYTIEVRVGNESLATGAFDVTP